MVRAAYNGQLEAAALLLDRGASPDKPNSSGHTPLMTAAELGHAEVVDLLAERGADLTATNRWGATAFHHACFDNKPSCVEALVRAGCDTAAKDKDGRTGKQLAGEQGNTEVLECLCSWLAWPRRRRRTRRIGTGRDARPPKARRS